MLYLNQISNKKEDIYALNFNGTNQYLESQTTAQGGKDFVQWEMTQPWTMFLYAKAPLNRTNGVLDTYGTSGRGIQILLSLNLLQIISTSTFGDLNVGGTTSLTNVYTVYQLTCNGDGTAGGLTFYENNVILNKSIFKNNTITGSVINANNKFKIASRSTGGLLQGNIQHFSFVNYLKTSTELTEDFNKKKQSKGTGEWLLAPIEPTYKDNSVRQIKTLSATNINQPLPNPNAFLNEQGYKLNLVNYPATLVKGVDLIKL